MVLGLHGGVNACAMNGTGTPCCDYSWLSLAQGGLSGVWSWYRVGRARAGTSLAPQPQSDLLLDTTEQRCHGVQYNKYILQSSVLRTEKEKKKANRDLCGPAYLPRKKTTGLLLPGWSVPGCSV